MALEIRNTEVEPQRRRADAAEAGLAELRTAANGWLAAAHTSQLDAAAEARATGYMQGHAEGQSDGEADKRSLKTELNKLQEEFSAYRAESREERLVLREAVADATQEAYSTVAAAATAGATAMEVSRDMWKKQGKMEGEKEGFEAGRAAAEAEFRPRLEAVEAARAAAAFAETELREAFAAYVIRAHERKLELVAAERAGTQEMVQGLAEELAKARGVLIEMLKVGILGGVCLCVYVCL